MTQTCKGSATRPTPAIAARHIAVDAAPEST
jgi:hypothetical protein